MDNYSPNQKVRILTVQIAVDASASHKEIADEIHDLLERSLCDGPSSNILDWQFIRQLWGRHFDEAPVVNLSSDPQEGEAFQILEILERNK